VGSDRQRWKSISSVGDLFYFSITRRCLSGVDVMRTLHYVITALYLNDDVQWAYRYYHIFRVVSGSPQLPERINI
jgi:hypothetical protein